MNKKFDYKKGYEAQLKYARRLVDKLNQYERALIVAKLAISEALTTKPKAKLQIKGSLVCTNRRKYMAKSLGHIF